MTTGRILLLVAAVGLAARLVCAFVIVPRFESATHVAPDPDRYAELAHAIALRGELGFDPPAASPTTVRGPAFPGWLAAGMTFGRSVRWLGFWAAIPGLAAALGTALALNRSHGRAAALAGGLIAAAHPLPIFFSARLLPDEAYGAWLLLGVASWIAATRSEGAGARIAWGASAGVLLAAASLTRVTALLAVAILAIVTVVRWPRARGAAGVATLLVCIPVGAWAVRTSALAGAPVIVESLPGYNFWLGESAARSGFSSGYAESRRRAHDLMAEEAGTPETASPSFWYLTLSPRDLHAFDATLRRSAVRTIERRPLAYAERVAAGLFWFWTRAESRSTTLGYAVVALPVLALALAGMSRATIVPASIVLGHLVLYAAICPMARYSAEVYPAIALLAGVGVARLGGRAGRSRSRVNAR